MPDYSDWPEKRLRPTALLLDVLNPRIPPVANPLSQRELIAELVAHDDVYDLAKTIVGVGFDPVESLIGIEDDGKVVILEGNRRLAALKLLNDPTLATPSDLSKFKRIAGAASVPDTVRVLIAPSREAAAPLILRKHTREQVAKWSRLQQARFYRRLVDTGGSVEQVAKKYGVTAGEIRDFLRMDSMYAVAQTMDLPEDVRETVHDPRSFPASVLERLLEVPSFRDFLTIDFDASGRVSAKTKPAAFRRAYGRVLTDIAKKKIDTRTLNKAAFLMFDPKRRHGPITPTHWLDKNQRHQHRTETLPRGLRVPRSPARRQALSLPQSSARLTTIASARSFAN